MYGIVGWWQLTVGGLEETSICSGAVVGGWLPAARPPPYERELVLPYAAYGSERPGRAEVPEL